MLVVNRTNAGILNLIDHYLVYLGDDNYGRPVFMANIGDRVQRLSEKEILRRASGFSIDRVRYFEGNESQRRGALQRAFQYEGTQYSLLGFNWEHFANWVQNGQVTSRQVNYGFAALIGLLVVGFLAGRD